MKKINVEYGVDGRILKLSDNAVHYEQENLTLHIDAIIPTDKNVRGYIKAPNGNSNVTDSLSKIEGVYTLIVEETFMAKGTLYVGFEAYDDNGYIERFEPLKVYVDGFVTLGGGNADNVYAVTVEVAEVETLSPEYDAYVMNVGTQKDVKLKFGIPQGIKGEKGDTATVSIGTVETVPPDVSAYVENVGTAHDAVLNFYITKGDKGEKPVAGQDYWTDEEKKALLYDAINSLPIDAELNVDSSNPVQNKIIADTVIMLERQIDDKVDKEDGKGLVAVDDNLDSNSKNPVQNKVVNDAINKLKGAINYDVLANNLILDNIDEDNLIIESSGIESQYIDKDPHPGYYDVIFKDTRARQMLEDIHMQKIFETTTTEVVDVINDDALKNLELDEVYVYIELPKVLTDSADWSCYVNNVVNVGHCLYYFKANTTGKFFMAKAERMCNGMWFGQKFSNLGNAAYNNNYASSYTMADVDYISRLSINCPGLPIGSRVVVCGRKVIE